eukprot:CAMPEP_0194687640 /NCGR_PEP_ID=MMETSP0295-20121207/16385_1 /TAXON_ID=39354 /ORGANISM="Heterosigma akashiwo, Strain CCMP2393" /LENGTH=236 /DNA_ID=CAMNT_0039576027 /DNA_START=119 /DNA_END=826 /DNA_ORIENTATION=-
MIEEEWESLRREARRLESSLEDKIQSYSRLAQRLNTDILYQDVESSPSLDNHEEQSLAVDIEHLLSALSDCNEKMNACVTAGSRTANSALLQRYREILFDYTTEFKNTSVAIQRKRESQELFRSARHGGGGSGGGAARPGDGAPSARAQRDRGGHARVQQCHRAGVRHPGRAAGAGRDAAGHQRHPSGDHLQPALDRARGGGHPEEEVPRQHDRGRGDRPAHLLHSMVSFPLERKM